MKRLIALALALALPVYAQDTGAGSAQPSAGIDFATAGSPAPFTGVLVKPDQFKVYLRKQLDLELCETRVQLRDKLLQEEAKKAERSFLENHGVLLGAVAGFVSAIFVVWRVEGIINAKK